MILDALTLLSDAQAVTSADAYSSNTYDLGNVTPKRRLAGKKMSIVITVDVAAGADGGSFTDTFDFIAVQSVNANLSSHDEMIKRRIPASELVAGLCFEIPIPADRPTKRYIGARYELGTDDTITVSAWLVPSDHVEAFIAYRKGYTV